MTPPDRGNLPRTSQVILGRRWPPKKPTKVNAIGATFPKSRRRYGRAAIQVGSSCANQEVAEKTIDQAERSFSAFIEAANKSVSMLPNPTSDMSLKALSLTEQNMKSAFDHTKKLLHANDLQEAMRI